MCFSMGWCNGKEVAGFRMNISGSSENVVLTLTGDFFCAAEFDVEERKEITQVLFDAENPIVNFEGALESGFVTPKSISLAADPSIIPMLRGCTLALANNHVLDFQKQGLDLLVAKLQENSIPFFGINSSSETIDNFQIVDIEGVRVCFVGFGAKNEECVPPSAGCPGVLNFDAGNLESSFDAIDRDLYDYLIVYAHIGYEFERFPLPLHVGLCRQAIDLGADLVYCSHAHCVQPYEQYNGKYIFYGLGNFYFSANRDRYPIICDMGFMIKVALSRGKRDVSLDSVDKIVYERPGPGFKVSSINTFEDEWKLGFSDLKDYSQHYSSLRTRKTNPRPILYFNQPIRNFVKYAVWKLVVDITGFLGVRQFVKRVLGWQ